MKKNFQLALAVCIMVFFMNNIIFSETWNYDNPRKGEETQVTEDEWQFLRSAVARTTSLDSMSARSTMTLNKEGQANPVTISSDLKFRNRNSGKLNY